MRVYFLPFKKLRLRLELKCILQKLTAVLIFLWVCISAHGQIPSANFTASPTAGCSPLVVNFTDQSTGTPTIWDWDFGNGATSTLQNPTTTFFVPGNYTIRLTASNAAGSHTLTRAQYITVYEPPTVDFTGSPTSGCFPLRTQFTDLSSSGLGSTNISWLWDLGNGSQSTAQNPFIIFNSAGNFVVTLKVTNDKGCSKVVSKPNYIQVPNGVVASFSNSQSTDCHPPTNISFTNVSAGPGTLSYSWDFGDGGTSASQSPIHTYLTGGNFTVTLTTSSSSGCFDTISHTVLITNTTTAVNSPDSACVNTIINFQNASTPSPNSAFWDFGDGTTSIALNPVKIYTSVGTYNIKLVNSYATCQDSIFKPIRILSRPVADFTAPVTTKCQPPLPVNFQDLSSSAVSWQWNFGDGGNSTLQNPLHTYNSYGSFDVTLIITSASGCTDTIIKPQFIKIRRAQISIPPLPARGCIPFTVNLFANINALDAVTSYFWDFGDGATSTSPTPSHVYPVQGTYTVKLVITTSSGCTDSLVIPAAVRTGTKPIVNFSGGPSPICAGQTVQFTDLTPPPVNEWLWYFGDGGTSVLQNPPHAYADTGFFNIKLIATNNGCPDSFTRSNYVYVLPPVARFLVTGTCSNRLQFTFTDQSIGPITNWLWDFGDGTTSTAQNPVHTYSTLGNYTVSLTVTNGTCTHTTTHLVGAVDESPDFASVITTSCKGVTIYFGAINLNYSNVTSYDWNFGNGTSLTTTVNSGGNYYYIPGYYTVSLVITDVNGCKDTIVKPNYIRINGPVAGFAAANPTGCAGFTTLFNDLTTTDGLNAIVNWKWDFGDGTVQTYTSPPFRHTYNNTGTYSVKLKVTDAAGCTDSLTQSNLIITTDPYPTFLALDSFTCPGASVSFLNYSAASNFTSFWDFGDGSTSTAGNATHTYLNTGSYTVKLRITDQYGCSDSLTRNQYIRVDKPIASFTINDSISSCTPFEVDFTNTSYYYDSSLWNFGNGGTSILANPIVYYTTPGTFLVKLYAISHGGCIDSAQKTIIVYDTAGSRINYTPLNGCKPLQLNLNAFTPGSVTYIWDYGDGNVDSTSTPNVNHIYNTFGDFIPKVILKDPSGCLIPITGPDTVRIIGADAKFGFDKHLLCDGGTVSFIDSTIFNNAVTQYQWDFGDGGTSSLQNPVHNYTIPGLYTVKLTVHTISGCMDSLRLPDTIRVVQSPLIAIGGDSIACIFDPMVHTGLILRPDTSSVSWSWTFPNGNTATVQNPSQQVYTVAGNYIISSIAVNSSGCRDTTTKNIFINPLPTVTLPGSLTMQAGYPVIIPATYSSTIGSYLWTPSSTLNCSTCPQPVAAPKFNTTYQVVFTDSNGCKNTGRINIIVICKNANVFVPNTFSPNGDGSNDVFYPRGKGINRAKILRIFDRWGEVVFEAKDFPINDPNYGWNGNYMGKKPQPGVYVYQIEFYCDNGDIIRFEGNVALIL